MNAVPDFKKNRARDKDLGVFQVLALAEAIRWMRSPREGVSTEKVGDGLCRIHV